MCLFSLLVACILGDALQCVLPLSILLMILSIITDISTYHRQEIILQIRVYGNKYGVYGGPTKSINPASLISGILFNNGFIQVNEVNPNNAKETMIVNFGETGRRNVNLGYSIEVTIQFISAYTQRPICTCTAEGKEKRKLTMLGEAIQRALKPLFN